MTDHPPASVDPSTLADHIDLLGAVRTARADIDRVRQLRSRREAGYSDLCSAEYRHALALQRARDAGLIVDWVSVDTDVG